MNRNLEDAEVRIGMRVVTNNGRWGTVIDRTCCFGSDKTHGNNPGCVYWDGWWEVQEDGDERLVMQNAERMYLHGVRMWDGTYLPEYDDPNPPTE